MGERNLTDEDIKAIVDAIGGHKCRFADDETRTLHMLAQSLSNGGWEKWNGVLRLGELSNRAYKIGAGAVITIIITGLLSAMWAGIKFALRGD